MNVRNQPARKDKIKRKKERKSLVTFSFCDDCEQQEEDQDNRHLLKMATVCNISTIFLLSILLFGVHEAAFVCNSTLNINIGFSLEAYNKVQVSSVDECCSVCQEDLYCAQWGEIENLC